MRLDLHNQEALRVLTEYPNNHFDSVVVDPPYGLSKEPKMEEVLDHWINDTEYEHPSKGFMGKQWDSFVPSPILWKEVLRVLKPGGHMVCFAGSRTQDLMGVSLRLAGFEIRDTMMYLFGSGFPKSYNISKGIDKKLGIKREKAPNPDVKKQTKSINNHAFGDYVETTFLTPYPSSDLAKQYDGYGTALKPAYEPIILARKPLSEKTIVENIMKWGVGGINIDASRVPIQKGVDDSQVRSLNRSKREQDQNNQKWGLTKDGDVPAQVVRPDGRHPANVLTDDTREVKEEFDQYGVTKSGRSKKKQTAYDGESNTGLLRGDSTPENQHGDSGTPQRFFYRVQTNVEDGRHPANIMTDGSENVKENLPYTKSGFMSAGQKYGQGDGQSVYGELTGHTKRDTHADEGSASRFFYTAKASKKERQLGMDEGQKNSHPTLKPIDLMVYLTRLVTPPSGHVLDCFMGSGTTGLACIHLGLDFTGVEMETESFDVAKMRIKNVSEDTTELDTLLKKKDKKNSK